MKRFLYTIALLSALNGCVYPFDVQLEETVGTIPAIEGSIVLGGTSTVRLHSVESLATKAKTNKTNPVTVYIEDDTGQRYDQDKAGSTDVFRVFPSTAKAPADRSYRLRVIQEHRTYSTDWISALPAPELTDINFKADNTHVSVQLSMKGGPGGQGYAAIEFEEIWQFHTEYMQMYGYNESNNSVFMLQNANNYAYYCWTRRENKGTVLLNYADTGGEAQDYPFHVFPRTDSRNHREYHIQARVRNISADEYRYRKTMENNESIGGNLFSPEPGEITSNLVCESNPETPVYGYVSISSIVCKEAAMYGEYLLPSSPQYTLLDLEADKFKEFYDMDYRPVDLVTDGGKSYIGWGPRRCFDCTYAGGSLDKLSFTDL